jgi:ribosomal protein S18 acetylase RimI-like enzyme
LRSNAVLDWIFPGFFSPQANKKAVEFPVQIWVAAVITLWINRQFFLLILDKIYNKDRYDITMLIRPYTEKDLNCMVRLYNETTLQLNWKDLNDVQKKIILLPNTAKARTLFDSNVTLVAEDKGEVRGFGVMNNEGYVSFLYVDVHQTRKGYGKKLLEALEKAGKDRGLKKVFLFASTFTAKNKIYEKMGYDNKGPEKYKIVGVEFEGNRLEKLLS